MRGTLQKGSLCKPRPQDAPNFGVGTCGSLCFSGNASRRQVMMEAIAREALSRIEDFDGQDVANLTWRPNPVGAGFPGLCWVTGVVRTMMTIIITPKTIAITIMMVTT